MFSRPKNIANFDCRKFPQSLEFHRRALVLQPRSASTYAAIGFVLQLSSRTMDAIEYLHKALALKRDDSFATTLLNNSIERLALFEDGLSDSECECTRKICSG